MLDPSPRYKNLYPLYYDYEKSWSVGTLENFLRAAANLTDKEKEADTVGRRVNHLSKQANLCPEDFVLKLNGHDMDVILFRALRNISVDTQLKFDYGVKRKCFRGPGYAMAR
ncbi:hypothetical protein AMELA_G00187280 [Ameiurus melas]|uniref:Uncharacterized protein n=1 Tax=Ameiurus melas TaxID=219545 RepID=A0A7J6ABP9_AMEME|nr:hypothetical protein AMELA_G00187280 [Ameiurus melas]